MGSDGGGLENSSYYWSIYQTLESEFVGITNYIHLDEKQLDVYSYKLTDLILRAATEIESICKDIYEQEDFKFKNNYDNIIEALVSKYKVDERTIWFVNSRNYSSYKHVTPFEKNTIKTGKQYKTYFWNNCYQNLKHYKIKSLEMGNIKCSIDILAALFYLNLFYENRLIDLENDATGKSVSTSFGSQLFALEVAQHQDFHTNPNFPKASFYTKMSDESRNALLEHNKKSNEFIWNELLNYPIIQDYLKDFGVESLTRNKLWELVGSEKMIALFQKANQELKFNSIKYTYEMVFNKTTYSNE